MGIPRARRGRALGGTCRSRPGILAEKLPETEVPVPRVRGWPFLPAHSRCSLCTGGLRGPNGADKSACEQFDPRRRKPASPPGQSRCRSMPATTWSSGCRGPHSVRTDRPPARSKVRPRPSPRGTRPRERSQRTTNTSNGQNKHFI